MSHTSKYKVKITDVNLFCQKAEELGYEVEKVKMKFRLYGSNEVDGVASIKVKGWEIPLVISEKGEIFYDHFGSAHGSMENFHSLLQDYNQDLTINSLPMDIVQNYYIEEIKEGRKIVVEY